MCEYRDVSFFKTHYGTCYISRVALGKFCQKNLPAFRKALGMATIPAPAMAPKRNRAATQIPIPCLSLEKR
uniref:Uncharacterized protein n=1 Tax=Romanomermis culicivorax TaxID=13658 RepID=A0A915JD83_ROMCU